MSIYYEVDLQDFGGKKINMSDLGKRLQKIILKDGFDQCRQVLQSGAMEMRNFIIMEMVSSPGDPNRPYYANKTNRKAKKLSYRSYPGNPPRPDTGALVGSIAVDDRWDEIEVGSLIAELKKRHGKTLNWKYPQFLETGTATMLPRPWLEPAYKFGMDYIREGIDRVLSKQMEQLGGKE